MRQVMLAALVCALAAGAQAQQLMYECDISQNKSQRGWIPSKMAIVLGQGRVQVIDEILIFEKQSPKAAQVVRNDDAMLVLRWDLLNPGAKNTKNAGTYSYDARLNKKTGRLTLGASPSEAPVSSARVSGRGACKPRTG